MHHPVARGDVDGIGAQGRDGVAAGIRHMEESCGPRCP
jgi:hypothetical protein